MVEKIRKTIYKYRFYIWRTMAMGVFTALLMQKAIRHFMDRFSVTKISALNLFIFNYSDVKNIFMLASFLILGRYFCAWICPLGLFSDIFERVFGRIRRRVLKLDIKIPYKLDAALFFLPFIFTPLLSGYFISGNNTVVVSFALLCLLSMVFIHGRIPCKYLCMAGSVPGLLSALSPFKIATDGSKCSRCKACSDKCSMAIDGRGGPFYKNLYCVRCFECFALCKSKALQWKLRIKYFFDKEKRGYTSDT